MSTDVYNDVRRNLTFDSMYGWITDRSKAKWLQDGSEGARFSKNDFDTKLASTNTNPSIVNAVFRKKKDLGEIGELKIQEVSKELFVTQLNDINRRKSAKDRIIETAILDFIYHDVEMAHLINDGNYTEKDFTEFKESCRERWQICYDTNVIREIEDYDDEMKNDLAIKIFDDIMNTIEVKFQEGISFDHANRYVHNGTFLKLSNLPEIGWHPEWETKYKK